MADSPPDTAGVIAPPPLITFAALAIGFVLEWAVPLATLPAPDARRAAGTAIALIAALAPFDSFRRFRRAGTHIEPNRETTALVTDGLYGVSRNPIYLSMLIGVVAVGLAAGSLWVIMMAAPLMAVLDRGVVRREERYLDRKFGEAYRSYRARVRRWV